MHQTTYSLPLSHAVHSIPHPPTLFLSPPWYLFGPVPLEDHGAADQDGHQQDHGPDGGKGSGLRGGRALALGQAGGNNQGRDDILW